MREIGVTNLDNSIFDENHSLQGGIDAAIRILKRRSQPTGIICSNDLMAIGVLKVLHSNGVDVPAEISVIGLDDIHLAEFTSPPLTTVRLPRTQLAEACFDALFRRLRPKEPQAACTLVVPTLLVVRESTSFPPHAPQSVARKKRRT
jgi:DNA-binding LacI/PurR family transcriptional regulator